MKSKIGFSIKSGDLNEFKAYAVGVGHPTTRRVNYRGVMAFFWSSSEDNSSNAYYFQIHNDQNGVRRFSNLKTGYQSVRCIKDK